MNKRKKYDSFIIWLINQNKDHLIPLEIKKQIPYSTISEWRNLNYSDYYGHEVRQIQNKAFEYYELFEAHKNLKKTINVITKVWVKVSKVIMPLMHKNESHKELIVNQVQHLFTVFKKSIAFKLVQISPSKYWLSLNQIKVQCGASSISLCLKRHPLQLAPSEVLKIKSLFKTPELKCWPSVSLYYYGIRNNNLMISKSTFYNYVNILGYKRRWNKVEKKKTGIRAKRPNDFLHVDTTFWELKNRQKAAIVFVSDNFSKMILGWSIALTKDAKNVKTALEKSICTIHHYHPDHITTTLVADGGGENNNMTIDMLLQKTTKPSITKVIALKDISFSNSPVEAINKIVKRYLRYYKPDTLSKLKQCIKVIVKNYNEIRPHGTLNGLTPLESYTNTLINLDFKDEKLNTKKLRILENKNVNCSNCK